MTLRRTNVEKLIELIEHRSKRPWKLFEMKDDDGNTLKLGFRSSRCCNS